MAIRFRISILFLGLLIFHLRVLHVMSRDISEDPIYEIYERWARQYGRMHVDSVEKENRFQIFKKNVEYIESSNNAGDKHYTLGINQFADLTLDEFKSTYSTGLDISKDIGKRLTTTSYKYENFTPPPSVDWRQQGAVTPVKQQGACASCWAFVTVATIESLSYIISKNLISLSEQELVDCVTSTNGCFSGSYIPAYEFVTNNHGIASDSDYPYTGVQKPCDGSKLRLHPAKISGYESLPPNDEKAMMKAVANQPVAVAINGDSDDFRFYKSGVFTGKCNSILNHGLTLVGYGTEEHGTKFWIGKNSWGDQWGEGGYVRLQREAGPPEGLCGIAYLPAYPTVPI